MSDISKTFKAAVRKAAVRRHAEFRLNGDPYHPELQHRIEGGGGKPRKKKLHPNVQKRIDEIHAERIGRRDEYLEHHWSRSGLGDLSDLAGLERALSFISLVTRKTKLSIRDLHLMLLVAGPHGIPIGAAAAAVGDTYPTVTHALQKLVRLGYLTKEKRFPGGDRGQGWTHGRHLELKFNYTQKGMVLRRELSAFDSGKLEKYRELAAASAAELENHKPGKREYRSAARIPVEEMGEKLTVDY
jgi:predicted transcriptional regulator